MDMAPHEPEGVRFAGHDTHIDASFIVSFDDHDMLIAPASYLCQYMIVELTKGPPVFDLHEGEDVWIDVPDHPRCVLYGDGIDGFLFQLDPADPTFPPLGDDLQGLASRPLEEISADGSEDGKPVAIGFR